MQPVLNVTDERDHSARIWRDLLLLVVVSLPPLAVALGRGDSNHTMENITVLTSQEAWLRVHGSPRDALQPDPNAWLLPTRDLRPRLVKPPGAVWAQLLTFTGLRPGDAGATPQNLVARARWSSVAAALVMIVSVFWLGNLLGGRRLAWAAALAAASMWFVQRQGRTASYDIHLAAWSALAAASGAWAIHTRVAWRRVAGWALAGVATGLAWYAKNPLALMLSAVPWACFIWRERERRRGHVVGAAGALALAVLMVGPWYVWVATHVPDAIKWWLIEARAERNEYHGPWYYLGLLGLVAPWTLWLVGGLAQPWVGRFRPMRRELLPAWLWFVAVFVLMSIPGAKQQRYILPIIPAAALLIGQLFAGHQRMADRGEHDAGVNALRAPHWAALLAASVAAPVIFAVKPQWMGRLPIAAAVTVGAALLALALLGARWHWQWRPMRAAAATAAWGVVFTTALWWAYAHGEHGTHPMRAAFERFNTLAPDLPREPVGMLVLEDTRPANEEFALYAQRVVHRVEPGALAGAPWRYVIADDTAASGDVMRAAGFVPAATFMQDKKRTSVLWERRLSLAVDVESAKKFN